LKEDGQVEELISESARRKIYGSEKEFGKFDHKGHKYVFCPNHVGSSVNPTHIMDMSKKIAEMLAQKKIIFVKKVFLYFGQPNIEKGQIAVFIYKLVNNIIL
jgi:hypothetical protein